MTKKNKEITVESYIGEAHYEPGGQEIMRLCKDTGLRMFLDVRGWGAIQNLFMKDNVIDMEAAAKFQDEVGEWVADAINQKLNQQNK